jgi:hypothetical protein
MVLQATSFTERKIGDPNEFFKKLIWIDESLQTDAHVNYSQQLSI